MDILFVHFRLPFYSVARKSFQVRLSLLLPPPSTLKGALARGLALLLGSKKRNLEELAKELVAKINEKLISTTAVSASAPTPLVRNYFLLKRLRTLESEKDKKKLEIEEEKKFSEKTDAMRREYIFTHEIYAIYIFKNLTEEEKLLYKKAATLIDNLGDTESLVSVVKADFVHIEKVPSLIEFYVPINKFSDKISKKIGIWRKIMIEDMQIDPNYGEIRVESFYVPLEEKKVRESVYYETNPIIETDFGIRVYDRVLGVWIPERCLKN